MKQLYYVNNTGSLSHTVWRTRDDVSHCLVPDTHVVHKPLPLLTIWKYGTHIGQCFLLILCVFTLVSVSSVSPNSCLLNL